MDPHMSKYVFTWYLKECLLKAKQTLIHVGNPPKKPVIRDKIKQLNFQKVGPKKKQPTIT